MKKRKKDQSIANDLEAMRMKAGLRQLDCAHLLGVTKARVSHFETGTSFPTAKQLVGLSIIYGKPMEVVAAGFLDQIVTGIVKKLKTMPPPPKDTSTLSARTVSLRQLAIRLEAFSTERHGG